MSEPSQAPAIPPPPSAPAPIREIPHALSHTVRGLSCPNCGGALDVDSGMRVVTCPFCRTPLLVLSEIGLRRLAVEPQIDSGPAREIARKWLARGVAKDPRLRREAELREAFLCFLPFFRVEADCVGIALGTEERRRYVGSGKNRRVQRYEVDVERKSERRFDRTYPALNVAEWGIRKVDLRGDPLVPFESGALDRRGMVFPPTGSEVEVKRAALEQFRQEGEPAAGLKRVRFRFLETLRERLTVVYYPLWVVRYRFRDRSYQILVDGQDGSLAYGKAAGNDFYRAAMLVATEAAACLFFTTALQVAGGAIEVMLVAGGLALALLLWGWKKFRYGGVVVEGTGLEEEPGFVDTVRTVRGLRPGRILGELAAGRRPRLGP